MYQICTRCVMDTTDPEITFDMNGYCNHCTNAFESIKNNYFPNAEDERRLQAIIKRIKKDGEGKPYDCLIGISGEINRDEALKELEIPLYNPSDLSEDKEFILEKLNFTHEEWDDIMALPNKNYIAYPNWQFQLKSLNFVLNKIRGIRDIVCPKNLRDKFREKIYPMIIYFNERSSSCSVGKLFLMIMVLVITALPIL